MHISFESKLKSRIEELLPEEIQSDPSFIKFKGAIIKLMEEREKMLLERAFNIGDIASKTLNEYINKEDKLKARTLEKLKDSVKNISREQRSQFDFDENNPLYIADYLNSEISKRKDTEADLLRTVTLLSTLLSNLPSGILIEDENGNVVFTNQIFCTLFSLPFQPEQLAGMDYSNLMEKSKHLFSEPDGFKKGIDHLLKKKVPKLNEELRMIDGKIVERDYIPIYINNLYKGHLWEYRDVTERNRFKQRLIDLTSIQNAILNGTDYSIIYTDINGAIKSFNKGAEDMLGYKASEIINVHTPALFHDSNEVLKRAKELTLELGKQINPDFDVFVVKAKEGIVDTNEWTYIQKNNKHITVLLSVSSIRGADNEITGYLGVARNITKQKEIEKSYQKSEERYKNMVERSTNVIYKTNQKGEFIFVNQVAEGLTGYTSKELLKKKYTDLIRPDKKTEAIVFYTKQVQDKIPSTYYEFPIITKGGKEKWIGQSVQLTEMDHDKTEFTALAIDITERINYEKLLVLQKEKYQNIITNMNLGMLEVDNEGRIQFANPGFTLISGYTYDELIGKKATDMFVERPHLKIVKGKLNQRAKGIADMYEIPVRNKRGEPRWWMISGAPNFDEKGNLIGSIGIHLDITDQKKIELELASAKSKAEESSRAKEAFLSNMSHEIRTPLNAIIGMIRELSKENLSEKQYKYVKNTYIASQHLLSVLNNVLDISKIDAGELQLDLHNFNLLSTLNDIKTIMMAKAAEKGLYLQLDQLEDKNICVYGDSGRFRQILLNLVGNAIKFTETGGINISYKVEIKHKGFKTISIWVKDTGVGMEEEFVKKIFNRFTQEDSSTSRKYGGSGLGMAITYELIQLMNGTIEVKSKKGEGTTVEMKFLLPIGDPTKLVENTPIYLSSMTEHLDILLVEDNEFNRMVAMDTLKYYNCNVTEAENGEQAIEILKKGRKFDVILMDLQMPVMNGFDATVIIRNELKLKIPIIALTANAFKSELEECIRIGMDDYVTKPFEDEKLLNTIYKFVAAPVGDLKKKPKVNTPLDESALYSLDRINAMSRDDKTYIMKMVSIFIEQAETSVSQIKSAYRKKDLELVYQIAHRIKPSIDGMGITSLKETIRTVEKLTKEKNDSVDLGKRIEFLCTTLQEVVIQLNKL